MTLYHSIDARDGKGNIAVSTRPDGQHHVTVNIRAPHTAATVALLRGAIEWVAPPVDYADGGVTAAAVEQESELDYWQSRAYSAEKRAFKAEYTRPLTADDITEAMCSRAADTFERTRSWEATLAAALNPEPQRPEWADVEGVVQKLWPRGINGATTEGIARMLHKGGLRVTGGAS